MVKVIDMKKIILITILLFIIPVYAQQELTPLAYQFELEYSSGKINFDPETLTLVNIYLPDLNNQPDEGYKTEVISFFNQKLYIYKFEFPLEIFSDYGEECFNSKFEFDPDLCPDFEPYRILDESIVILSIPYYPTGRVINLLDENDKLILGIDISDFSSFCGDDKCELDEKRTCTTDCGELSEKSNILKQIMNNENGLYPLGLALIFIALIIAIFLKTRKK